MSSASTCVVVSVCAGLAGLAGACISPPPPVAPPEFWVVPGAMPNQATLYIGLADVFTTITPHDCACGLGVGSPANPVPAGFLVHSVGIGVLDKPSHAFTPITPFSALASNPAAVGAWANGPQPPNPLLGSPLPGATWFPFSGQIAPVSPPALLPSECFVICFDVWLPQNFQVVTLDAQFGGGLGEPDGTPLYQPGNPHSTSFSMPFQVTLPAPGSLACAGLGLLAWSRGRR